LRTCWPRKAGSVFEFDGSWLAALGTLLGAAIYTAVKMVHQNKTINGLSSEVQVKMRAIELLEKENIRLKNKIKTLEARAKT
jgi:hypothetical protein